MGLCSSRSKADVELGQENVINSDGKLFRRARGKVENKLKDFGGYLPLYKAAVRGEWEEARKFLDKDPEALSAKITIASETALHIAVGARKEIKFVESLIRRMSPEDLALTDQNGETALSVAAVVGNLGAAKLLVNKNPDLPNISGKYGLPIHRAADYAQKEMIRYLLDVTGDDVEPSPFAGKSGGQLLVAIITAEFFDIALMLVARYPDIATAEVPDKESPLTVLASKSRSFPSGQTTTYHPERLQYWKRKQKQREAIELVRTLCEEILQLDDARAFELLRDPLLIAAELGTHEIIEEIVEAFPPAIWASDEENRNIFELAVLHRRENVFNLIYKMSNYKNLIIRYTDKNDNNILHLAGQLPSSDRLKLVSGPALQMQRELQWFEEVEKCVEPARKEAKNKDGKTPWTVFREAHQDLMKEAEAWMKSTASACTVASTLIATVVFTAAIRVPGGEKENGFPKLQNHTLFGFFAVTDAISLFASVTAVIFFLSILTSRYSVEDFLRVLPKRLVFGLLMLFISIISMTAAFNFAIFLLFGNRAIFVIGVGTFSVLGTLAWLMLPLLVQYFGSTLCGGIFGKQPRIVRYFKSTRCGAMLGKQKDPILH